MLKRKVLINALLNTNYRRAIKSHRIINYTFRRHCHVSLTDYVSYREEESIVKKEIETDTAWLKSEAAIQTLKLGKKVPTKHIISGNMKDYISQRGYLSALTDPSAERILSSCMTFPLTLAYAQKLLYPNLRSNVKVLVIGARAESSMPIVWWFESLYSNDKSHTISIKMIGPGIQKVSNQVSNDEIDWKIGEWSDFETPANSNSEVLRSSPFIYEPSKPKVEISVPYSDEVTKLLHENDKMIELLQWADMFVLYNPGMSSVPLKADWDPTVRILLQTRKPIICTAHGDKDLENDLNLLNKISTEEDTQEIGEPLEFLFPPHLNPFRSSKRTIDPHAPEGTAGRIVTTNHYVYAFQSK